jgi:flavin-dependent dehydrogenase
MTQRVIRIHGAGPAGSAAAIAACQFGADVRIVVRLQTPRHKVCGEFISSEACQVLQKLGAIEQVFRLIPARTYRCRLRFGSRTKEWKLSEPALGLSRLELDRLLVDRAAALGANVVSGHESLEESGRTDDAIIAATGRSGKASKPGRLFAFKSHFCGPVGDAVEHFFSASRYVGLSSVENGLTNVCGIATETALRRFGFQFDDFIYDHELLADRLKPLTRVMPWLSTGPLVFSRIGGATGARNCYPAGDALGFVDPFTGSGILNALLTGRMAGAAAAKAVSADVYLQECANLLHRPFAVSAVFRTLLDWGVAPRLATLLPGDWIYRLTRAGVCRW